MASTPDERVLAFGKAVRIRREELGLSQEALGFKAKVHRTYVSDVERGARNPTVRVIWKLADALDTTPSALFEGAEGVLAGSG
jgi:transcriptional regulator with XRE-family HTH domain